MIYYVDRSHLNLPSDYPSNEVFVQIVGMTIMVSVLFGFMHKVIIFMKSLNFLVTFYISGQHFAFFVDFVTYISNFMEPYVFHSVQRSDIGYIFW